MVFGRGLEANVKTDGSKGIKDAIRPILRARRPAQRMPTLMTVMGCKAHCGAGKPDCVSLKEVIQASNGINASPWGASSTHCNPSKSRV